MGIALAAIAALASTGLGAASAAAVQPASPGPVLAGQVSPDSLPFAAPAELSGVYCTSPANCWAVGSQIAPNGAEVNQAEHWTGKAWSQVKVPNPGGTKRGTESTLFAVRCPTAADCWAVGEYASQGSGDLSQALHWNGKKWSVVPTPSPGGTIKSDFNTLDDVACSSSARCWAVGSYGSFAPTTTELNEVLRWNGKTWTQVKTPNPAGARPGDGNAVESVRCASASDCWAGGGEGHFSPEKISNELLHWNGKSWVNASVPNPGGLPPGQVNVITGLSCTSTRNCWAAGSRENESQSSDATRVNELLHWNGAKWLPVKAPDPDGTRAGANNQLAAINCASTIDCWAVGQTGGTDDKPTLNQALHWNGSAWSAISIPEPAGKGADVFNGLAAVRCTSPGNCWAVGSTQSEPSAGRNETLHWTGKKWFADSSSNRELSVGRARLGAGGEDVRDDSAAEGDGVSAYLLPGNAWPTLLPRERRWPAVAVRSIQHRRECHPRPAFGRDPPPHPQLAG